MSKDIELKEVINSKVFVKENSAVGFLSPSDYLGDFIEATTKIRNEGSTYRTQVARPVVNQETTGERNIAYPRVSVEVSLGELIEGFDAVVGMIYALDLQKPIIKAYSGFNVTSCINLTIFNADNVFQQELLGDYKSVHSKAREYIAEKEQDVLDFKNRIAILKETNLNENQLNELLGKMLRESHKSRLGTTPVLGAAKLLDNNSSTYYVRPDGKFTCSKFNVYNAVTQVISDSKDIVDKPNKTIELSKIMLN